MQEITESDVEIFGFHTNEQTPITCDSDSDPRAPKRNKRKSYAISTPPQPLASSVSESGSESDSSAAAFIQNSLTTKCGPVIGCAANENCAENQKSAVAKSSGSAGRDGSNSKPDAGDRNSIENHLRRVTKGIAPFEIEELRNVILGYGSADQIVHSVVLIQSRSLPVLQSSDESALPQLEVPFCQVLSTHASEAEAIRHALVEWIIGAIKSDSQNQNQNQNHPNQCCLLPADEALDVLKADRGVSNAVDWLRSVFAFVRRIGSASGGAVSVTRSQLHDRQNCVYRDLSVHALRELWTSVQRYRFKRDAKAQPKWSVTVSQATIAQLQPANAS